MSTETVWGTPSTGHKCQGSWGAGGLTWPACPQHSGGCQHGAVRPSHACLPLPPPHPHSAVGRAGPSGSALQSCVQSKAQVTLAVLAPALGTGQGQEDWHGAPVGVGVKAVLLLESLPEGIDCLWHIQRAEEHLEEQMHKEAGEMHGHDMRDTGHLEDLPHHHSCLQRTEQPETALSAEVSVWQGPSVGGRGQWRRRGSAGPGGPEAAPRLDFSPAGRSSETPWWRGDGDLTEG